MAKLWIGQPNYSSWSLRGWLACRIAGIDPAIRWVRFDEDDWQSEVPSNATVPVLELNGATTWDSAAIIESLADAVPDAPFWPADPALRAHARSIVAEMHSGFVALRSACPMNIRARAENFPLTDAVFADIARIQDILETALENSGGPYLYGNELGAADAFYAPVLYRLRTYAPVAHCELADYSQRLLAHPWLVEWEALAQTDPAFARSDAALAQS